LLLEKQSGFYINDQKILLKPFILPHLSKLSQPDLDRVGGKDRLRMDQGFYIYRNKRLIVWGTWFRLERKDELNKLARVLVDIPNSLDYMWSIDIKKSTAILPDILKKNMFNAVYEAVRLSENVIIHRTRHNKTNKEIDYIWERDELRDGYKYRINRNIPQIKLLEETLNGEQVKIMNSIIRVLEESFPTSSLYVDVAKGNIIERKNIDSGFLKQIWDDLQEQIVYVKSNNLPILEYYNAFMKVEPYCNHKEIIEKINEEINKYEYTTEST